MRTTVATLMTMAIIAITGTAIAEEMATPIPSTPCQWEGKDVRIFLEDQGGQTMLAPAATATGILDQIGEAVKFVGRLESAEGSYAKYSPPLRECVRQRCGQSPKEMAGDILAKIGKVKETIASLSLGNAISVLMEAGGMIKDMGVEMAALIANISTKTTVWQTCEKQELAKAMSPKAIAMAALRWATDLHPGFCVLFTLLFFTLILLLRDKERWWMDILTWFMVFAIARGLAHTDAWILWIFWTPVTIGSVVVIAIAIRNTFKGSKPRTEDPAPERTCPHCGGTRCVRFCVATGKSIADTVDNPHHTPREEKDLW